MKNPLLKIKLEQKQIYLIVIIISFILSNCAYNPKKLTPHFVDPDRMTTREYHVIKTDPEIVFEYSKENSIKDAVINNGGLLCLPVPQALEIKRKYETYIKKKKRNSSNNNFETSNLNLTNYPSSIDEELSILNGIESWQN